MELNGKPTESDHNTMFLELNLNFTNVNTVRTEYFNLKNTYCQETFKHITENTNKLSKCFESNLPFLTQANVWTKSLISILQQSFKKVRIKSKVCLESEVSKLLKERRSH